MRYSFPRSLLCLSIFATGITNFGISNFGMPLHAQSPATVQSASKVIDFVQYKPVGKDPKMLESVTASQRYETGGDVATITKQITDKLKADGWKELEGSYATADMASASFLKSQFVITLSVSPAASTPSKDARSIVSLTNLGNLEWAKLPLPKGWTSTYSMPSMAMYQTDGTPEKAKQELDQTLMQAGWEPYGNAIGSSYYRREAIKLMASIQAAPTVPGKSIIQFSSQQLSYAFPIPKSIKQLQHTDPLLNILFDTNLPREQAIQFYRDELAKKGWKATTDAPIRIRHEDHTIFVNDSKERMEVAVHEFEGLTRVKVQFVTAAQAAEENKKASIAAEQAKAKNEAAMANAKATEDTELAIVVPSDAKPSKVDSKSAKWSLPSGQGAALAKKIIAALEKDGWKSKQNVAQKEAGDFELQKGEFRLNIDYLDPGFIPAEVEIQVFGPGKIKLKSQ